MVKKKTDIEMLQEPESLAFQKRAELSRLAEKIGHTVKLDYYAVEILEISREIASTLEKFEMLDEIANRFEGLAGMKNHE